MKEEVIQIPIMYRSVPYVYIKINDVDNKYRLSANYKYLNEHYNLRMNMIRDFNKIDIKETINPITKESTNQKETPWFVIYNNSTIVVRCEQEWQNWEMGSGNNTLNVKRIIIPQGDSISTIMIFYRRYFDEYNCSLFFSSNKFYNINELLGMKGV